MTTLKFVDTHNMVAFLSKPAESEGFKQIATVKAKTVNGKVQLQALVDGKKIIITESTMRRDLQLEDVEGVDCLPNATIFEQLSLIGYEQVLIVGIKRLFDDLRVTAAQFLETRAYRHEWQRQDAADRATGHIMRIQALEARARIDTLEDTSSSA
ncbi:hypothetical protein Tco_0554171 [Tanacetum coccineum]